MERLSELFKFVKGLTNSADIYNGNGGTKPVRLSDYKQALFAIEQKTAGSNTGIATITVEACDDATPSNTTAIAFDYVKNESCATADAMNARTAVTSAGFVTTANKDALYLIDVRASDLPDGYPFVRVKVNEEVNDPVLGSILIVCGDGPKAAPVTAGTVIA